MPGLRSAAFFDLDKTVIARSSVLAMSGTFYRGGLLDRRTVVRCSVNQVLYVTRGAGHAQMERARRQVTAVTAGWEVQQVRDIIAGAVAGLIGPLVYAEAVQLIEAHRRAGRDVVIVSAAGEELVRPIAALLGIDRVIASRMVERDGRWTGAVDFYAYGPAKADAVRELAARQAYDLSTSFAYSDSVTDLPLLLAVGRPVAVNPDRPLRREAARRQWPVHTFRRPVDLPRRGPAPVVGAASATLALGALAVGRRVRATRPPRTANR